jgi:hypothetical protein
MPEGTKNESFVFEEQAKADDLAAEPLHTPPLLAAVLNNQAGLFQFSFFRKDIKGSFGHWQYASTLLELLSVFLCIRS